MKRRFAVKQTANPIYPWKVICFETRQGLEVRSEFLLLETDEREKYRTERGARKQVEKLTTLYGLA